MAPLTVLTTVNTFMRAMRVKAVYSNITACSKLTVDIIHQLFAVLVIVPLLLIIV
jgi:hypothetical protein